MLPQALDDCVAKLEDYPAAVATGDRKCINGILDLGHFSNLDAACQYAARAEIAGSREPCVLRFTYTGAAGKVSSFILQAVKGDDVAMQLLFDKCTIQRRNVTGATGTAGDGTSAYSWEEVEAQKLEYNQSNSTLTMKSYENGTVATVTFPLATTSAPGLMSSSDKTKLSALPTATALNNSLTQLNTGFEADRTKVNALQDSVTAINDRQSVFEFDRVIHSADDGSRPGPDECGLAEKPGSIAAYVDANNNIEALLVGDDEQWIELPASTDSPNLPQTGDNVTLLEDDDGTQMLTLRPDAFYRINVYEGGVGNFAVCGLYCLRGETLQTLKLQRV